MATDFIMPRLPDPGQNPFAQAQQQQQQQPINFAPQHYNQQISPLSTSNNSPTSPKSYHARQLRPLYMPAVLRPTEHPPRAPPAKSKSKPEADSSEGDKVRSSGSFISLPGLASIGMSRLSRRSTGDSAKGFMEGWNLDMFPEVNGQPSRAHWKPDPDSTICDEPTCQRHFTYFTRRHHCRRCGNIFCDSHSAHEVPLDEKANYNPRGSVSRSCGHCFTEFKAWRSRTNSQASSNGATPRAVTAPTSPVAATPVPLSSGGGGGAAAANGKQPDAAQSVPHDWNWSTF